MSNQPGRQEPTDKPVSTGSIPSGLNSRETLVWPSTKLVLLGDLLATSTNLTRSDVDIFIQELAPLLSPATSENVVANLCDAAKPFLAAGAPVAMTLKLCSDLLEQSPPADQLTTELFTELFRADAALRSFNAQAQGGASPVPDLTQERRTLLPYLTALSLLRPGLSGRQAGSSVRAIGEILVLAPLEPGRPAQNHRLLRDLDPLLAESAQAEDLTCLAALLRNAAPSGPAAGAACFRTFCSIVPQLRAEAPSVWGEVRVATRAAIRAGFGDAWQIIPAHAELRRARRTPTLQRAYLLSMVELPKDPAAPEKSANMALSIAKLWAALPPPDGACRDLSTALSQLGATGLFERILRVTARGFELGEPETVHLEALAKLAGAEPPASSSEPLPAKFRRRLKLMQALGSLSTGHAAAFEFDLRRLPGHVFSPLVRSALCLGDVHLVHSDEFRSFPGHGVFITNLFSAASEAPLKQQLEPLRAVSSVFDRNLPLLPQVKVLCTPGLLVFSPPSTHTLPIRSDQRRHFSLALFSQSHRQTSIVHALLVDTTWLKAKVSFCLKEWRSDWSAATVFDSAADIRAAGLRPEGILAENGQNKVIALDVSSPQVLLRGFAASVPESTGRAAPEGLGREVGRYLATTLELFSAWRIGMAHVHKGLAGVPAFIDEQGAAAEGGRLKLPAILDPRLTPLVDVLTLHHALATTGNKPLSTDPILVTTKVEDYSDTIDGDLVLDVRTLAARSHGLEKELFESGTPFLTPRVQRIWLERFLPSLERNPLQDLRFYERRDLPRR